MRRVCQAGFPGLLALLLLGACAPPTRLLDERRTAPYADLLRRGDALAARSYYVRSEDPGAAPLVVHVRDLRAERPGGAVLLVLVPGVMSDRRTWRFLAPLLAERYDLLLVDPPGTGWSDKPAPETLPADGYSPAWLGRHELRAVRTHVLRRARRARIVLVGHSLGATSLLRALAEPSTCQEMPDLCARIDRLVLISPPDVAMQEIDEQFEAIATLSDLEAVAGGPTGILAAKIREGVYESVEHPAQRALVGEADRTTAILEHPAMRHAVQAQLRRFRPVDARGEPIWPEIRAQVALHANVRQPTLILWGAQDESLPPGMGRQVRAQLPDARLEVIEDAKHSPHQERPAEVCARIVRFLEERPR